MEEYLTREGRTLSEHTIKSYRVTLQQATKMLKDKAVSKTTRNDIENILWINKDSFFGRGLKPSVVNARRDHLKTFLRWCRVQGYIREDITYRLRALPEQPVVRRQFDAKLLLDALDAAPNPRDRALLALGTFTGCRLSEIKAFRLRDLDLKSWVISGIIIKTHKTYSAKMCPELRVEIQTWLTKYAHELGFISAEALVAHAKKNNLKWHLVPRMSRPILGGFRTIRTDTRTLIPDEPIENVYHMLRVVFDRVGIDEDERRGLGFHALRRSAARHMYEVACRSEKNKDRAMRMVQLYLDHSTMAVTEKYVGITVEKAMLNEMLEETPLLGEAYAERYGAATSDNVLQFRRKDGEEEAV
jgi:integrase